MGKNSLISDNILFDELIYNLIFSEEIEFNISIGLYISDIYKYDRFILKVKSILKRSRVGILKEKVLIDPMDVNWYIKITK